MKKVLGRLDLNCLENQLNSFNLIVIYLNASLTAQWPITNCHRIMTQITQKHKQQIKEINKN
jgi:hypothetical protein